MFRIFGLLSLILYFKSVPNIICIDPQYLLDMLSNMTSVSFTCHPCLLPGVQHQLMMKGTFNDLLLDELKSLNLFNPSLRNMIFWDWWLIFVLLHLYICTCTSHTEYFIPVVLPEKEKDREKLRSDFVEPFLIKFDIGLVPQVNRMRVSC